MAEVYPGRMFTSTAEDYDAIFDYGIGAMCWTKDKEGRRKLFFVAPDVGRDRKIVCAEIYTMTNGEDWTIPGPVNGWDGNLEKPTFSPSIWLLNREGWHGFIRQGNLVTA